MTHIRYTHTHTHAVCRRVFAWFYPRPGSTARVACMSPACTPHTRCGLGAGHVRVGRGDVGEALGWLMVRGRVLPRGARRWRREVRARRTLVPERWLARTLAAMTAGRRAGWPGPKRLVWLGRDAEERVVRAGGRVGGGVGAVVWRSWRRTLFLPEDINLRRLTCGAWTRLQELLRQRLGLPAARQQQPAQALPGRQTGSLEWRQQRGETGACRGQQPASLQLYSSSRCRAHTPWLRLRLLINNP